MVKLRWGRIGALLGAVALVVGAGFGIAHFGVRPLWDRVAALGGAGEDAATAARVRQALTFSTRLAPFPIEVTASGGVVRLAGTVPTDDAKALAGSIARDTQGVASVTNDIAVNPGAQMSPEAAHVYDMDLRASVADALARSPELKDQHVDVAVANREVTLSGRVQTPQQKSGAEQVAAAVGGVAKVVNTLGVAEPDKPAEDPTATAPAPPSDDELAKRVRFELFSTDAIDIKNVEVKAASGRVTLSGRVASKAERLLADRVARDVPSVTAVDNQLTVTQP